jgi:UDP-glucose 4-epimerase
MSRPVHTVVFGSGGNIGSRLCRMLTDRGLPVTGVSSATTDMTDPQAVARAVAHLRGTPVRAALLSFINKHLDNSRAAFERNLDIVESMAAALAGLDTRGLVFFSTVDIYGDRPPLPLTEATAVAPADWYGMAKFTCERLLTFGPLGDRLTVWRLPGVYGNWSRPPNSIIGSFVMNLARGVPLRLDGTGGTLRDYVHVDDVCALTLAALERGRTGIFNVVTGHSRSIRECLELITGRYRPDHPVIRNPGASDKGDLVFDPARLRAVFPDCPPRDLPAGLPDTLPAPFPETTP